MELFQVCPEVVGTPVVARPAAVQTHHSAASSCRTHSIQSVTDSRNSLESFMSLKKSHTGCDFFLPALRAHADGDDVAFVAEDVEVVMEEEELRWWKGEVVD